MTISASAPAKIILFGEHAVVYNQPAVAVPVSSLRVTCTAAPSAGGLEILVPQLDISVHMENTPAAENPLLHMAALVLDVLKLPPPALTLTLHSQVPAAGGLGSGAAVSAALGRALSAALGHPLPDEQLNALVYEVEKFYHGTPSGIDNTVVVYEKPVYFTRDEPIQLLSIHTPFLLIIADTGRPARTHLSVGDVRGLYETEPARIWPIFEEIGRIAAEARRCIESGELARLGPLMDKNHGLLHQLTVSSEQLDTLVLAARRAGAGGAKLSGGGRGGNMIALVSDETVQAVCRALLDAGAVRLVVTEVKAGGTDAGTA